MLSPVSAFSLFGSPPVHGPDPGALPSHKSHLGLSSQYPHLRLKRNERPGLDFGLVDLDVSTIITSLTFFYAKELKTQAVFNVSAPELVVLISALRTPFGPQRVRPYQDHTTRMISYSCRQRTIYPLNVLAYASGFIQWRYGQLHVAAPTSHTEQAQEAPGRCGSVGGRRAINIAPQFFYAPVPCIRTRACGLEDQHGAGPHGYLVEW